MRPRIDDISHDRILRVDRHDYGADEVDRGFRVGVEALRALQGWLDGPTTRPVPAGRLEAAAAVIKEGTEVGSAARWIAFDSACSEVQRRGGFMSADFQKFVGLVFEASVRLGDGYPADAVRSRDAFAKLSQIRYGSSAALAEFDSVPRKSVEAWLDIADALYSDRAPSPSVDGRAGHWGVGTANVQQTSSPFHVIEDRVIANVFSDAKGRQIVCHGVADGHGSERISELTSHVFSRIVANALGVRCPDAQLGLAAALGLDSVEGLCDVLEAVLGEDPEADEGARQRLDAAFGELPIGRLDVVLARAFPSDVPEKVARLVRSSKSLACDSHDLSKESSGDAAAGLHRACKNFARLLLEREGCLRELLKMLSSRRVRGAISSESYSAVVNAVKEISAMDSGSTVALSVIIGDRVLTANVGDSRAYLEVLDRDSGATLWFPLTLDQKPDNQKVREFLHTLHPDVTVENVEGVWRLRTPEDQLCGDPGTATPAFGDLRLGVDVPADVGEISLSALAGTRFEPRAVIATSDGIPDCVPPPIAGLLLDGMWAVAALPEDPAGAKQGRVDAHRVVEQMWEDGVLSAMGIADDPVPGCDPQVFEREQRERKISEESKLKKHVPHVLELVRRGVDGELPSDPSTDELFALMCHLIPGYPAGDSSLVSLLELIGDDEQMLVRFEGYLRNNYREIREASDGYRKAASAGDADALAEARATLGGVCINHLSRVPLESADDTTVARLPLSRI